jgi:ligand-binding sensor domain-containing protein
MLKQLLIFLLYIILYFPGSAQPWDQLSVDHKFMSDKPFLKEIRCFVNDKNGFLWIGGHHGLSRHDGFSFSEFLHNPQDPNSIPSDVVYSILCDEENTLWILLYNYVIRFYPESNKYDDYSIGICNGLEKRVGGSMGKMFFDQQNRICFVNDQGFSYLDKSLNKFVNHSIPLTMDSSKTTGVMDFILEDEENLLLLCKEGLVRFNVKSFVHEYIQQTVQFIKTLPKAKLICGVKDIDGKIWIGTWGNGLIIFDLKNGISKQFLIEDKPFDPSLHNVIIMMNLPVKGEFKNDILIGTMRKGTYRIKQAERSNFEGFKVEQSILQIESSNELNNINMSECYVDINDITYFGSNEGISIVNPIQLVQYHRSDEIDGAITSIVKKKNHDGEMRYYISSTYYGGFYIYDESLNLLRSYKHVPIHSISPESSRITSLYVDLKNQLWVCTLNGLYLFDETKNTFLEFRHKAGDANSILNDRVNCIYQDHNNIFWIGFYDKGIQCYDQEKAKFFEPPSSFLFKDALVNQIIQDGSNNYWILLDGLIIRLNPEGVKHEDFQDASFRTDAVRRIFVNSLFLDSQDRIWLATRSGLKLHIPETEMFKGYDQTDGLLQNEVLCIAQDNLNNIWIGHLNGISILNTATDDIIVIRSYGSGYFNCDNRGTVVAAVVNAQADFCVFDANLISKDLIPPKPCITSILIAGYETPNRMESAVELNRLELNYNENFLTFYFTGVSFNDAELNQFRCKMEGLDPNWYEMGTLRSMSYAAIEPGDYNFLVMSCNADGIWNTEPASVHIHINPPFWKTWWFRGLVILCSIAFLTFIYRRHIRNLEQKEAIKTQLAIRETQALLAQMNPHFIFNSLNSIQACIVSNNNDAAYNYLNKFSKLVRSILQNSRESFILLSDELDVLKNYLELEQLRFKDMNFNILVSTEVNINMTKVPSSFLQPFVENAIIHGLAHKIGTKELEIIVDSNSDGLLFSIKDNGIGREKAAEVNKNRVKSHTSIGTSIVTSRLDLINEQYGINSKFEILDILDERGNSAGTEVRIFLPHTLQDELF